MPPSATSQARHIVVRLHERLPELRLVVGVWDMQRRARVSHRLPSSEVVTLASTLAQAIQALANSNPVEAPTADV
jgi:hypothetical protein